MIAISPICRPILFALMLPCCSDAWAGSIAPPKTMIGTWDVSAVRIDPKRSNNFLHDDDLHVLGREFIIGHHEILDNYSDDGICTVTRWKNRETSWKQLISESQFRIFGDPVTLMDYRLKVSGTAHAYFPLCKEGPSNYWTPGTWIAPLGPDSLLLRFSEDTLFVLTRRQPSTHPNPSFPCNTAKTPAEKTLCSSVTLAAMDRNFAKALEIRARDWSEEDRQRDIVLKQRYIQERDACGTSTKCLTDVLKNFFPYSLSY